MDTKPLVLIMCGGRGLRLWPLSEYKSKNFLDIFGFSPLEITIKRFLKITPRKNIFLVANESEKKFLQKIKLIPKENIFFEPASRNTAAAVAFSIFYLKKRFSPSSNLIISPVDHLVKGDGFYRALYAGLRVSSDGYICTFGIEPKEPTPNFGYIQVSKITNKGIFFVKRFIEKPSARQAEKLIKRGDSFYNSGMFMARLDTLDSEFSKYYKGHKLFTDIFNSDLMLMHDRLKKIYKKIDDIPFDKAIMEKTKKAVLVKADFYWRDFGSWHTVYEILPKDDKGNVKNCKGSFIYSRGNFIHSDDNNKKILALGVSDLFLVDTQDYIFIAARSSIDKIKSALNEFKNA